MPKKVAKPRPKAKRAAGSPEAVSRPFAKLARRADRGEASPPPERRDAPVPAARGEKRALTTERADDVAFATHMQGVARLRTKPLRIPATVSEIETSGRGAPTRAPKDPDAAAALDGAGEGADDLARLVVGGLRFEVVDDGTLLEGRRLDVDPRELRRLRTQRYPVDGKLDLHGQNVAGAREAVERFVERRRAQGDRAIVIVHGKGLHSSRGAAVLRGELGAWLSQGRAARSVLAFASLEDEGGGSGALMVLLAKR